MGRLNAYLARIPRWIVFVVTLALTAVIGYLDYITGPDLAFSIFYLLPVALATWYGGVWYGVAISLAGGLAWFLGDFYVNREIPLHAHIFIAYWNALVGFFSFLLVTLIMNWLRNALERQQQTIAFLVHDLRSPLTSVLTGLQTLESLEPEEQATLGKELTGLSISAGTRMLSMITSLLDLSRLEHRAMPLHTRNTDARELLEQAYTQVALWARQEEVTLTIDAESMPVFADATLTVRILVNLLSNALKYAPRGSVVTLGAAATDGAVRFRVRDEGPGIPPKWQRRIFERFAQVEARGEGVSLGSGLGLSFAAEAVRIQGGRIWIESAEGHGTTMYFTLPAPLTGAASETM